MRTTQLQWIPAPAPTGVADLAATRDAESTAAAESWPAHDPRLAPRDELIFLLHTAAEVEHALLAQYLYAAWSLGAEEADWSTTIQTIAKQEMGHLITIQNVLRALGGPLNFEREDYPFRSAFYPFHFRLEPVSIASLAKYVIAEMPEEPEIDPKDLAIIRWYAEAGNVGQSLNRVGALYAQIQYLIDQKLSDRDFHGETLAYQARYEDWFGSLVPAMIIEPIPTREAALNALHRIAVQGEGMSRSSAADAPAGSHFAEFLRLYKARAAQSDPRPVRPIVANPNTSRDPLADPAMELGRITHPRSRAWAQLFNLRYRMLLTDLAHTLSLGSDTGPNNKPTNRADVRLWTFLEMYGLSSIARILTSLPQLKGAMTGPPYAGPPFELPYSLALPDQEADRWRLHRDLIKASEMLIAGQELEKDATPDERGALDMLTANDTGAKQVIESQIGPEMPA